MTTDENEQETTPPSEAAAPPPAPEAAAPQAEAAAPEAAPAAAEDAAPVDASASAEERPASERPAGDRPMGDRAGGDRPMGDRPPRRDAGGDGEGPRRRHFGRRRVCAFCADKVTSIDYKDAMRLRRFLSDRARIEPRRKTGTCAKHQRWLASALKRARHLALLPYTPEHIRTSGVSTGRGR